MLALAMNPAAPADSTQSVKTNTNKRVSEPPDTTGEMLTLAPQPVPSKRPKLSLQTSSLPITFGKSSTALAMTASALPTASPTVLNTFNNAYDLPRRPSPASTPASTPRLTQRPPRTMASLVSRREDDWPYKVPLGIRGILRNTPIPAPMRVSSVCSNSASPRNGRRVFFPPTKRVCYRHPLEEEVTTVRFIARHSDLSSSDESDPDSAPETESEDLDESFDAATSDEDSRIQAWPKKSVKKYSHRQIRAAGVRDRPADGKDQTATAKTPADRRKKRRWEWTLGPLDEEVAEQSTPNVQETSAGAVTTTSDEGQASTSPAAESPYRVSGQTIQSPVWQRSPPSSTPTETVPLPSSPPHMASREGSSAV